MDNEFMPNISKGEETTQETPRKSGGKKKIFIILLIVLAIVLFAWFFMKGGEDINLSEQTLAGIVALDKEVECSVEDRSPSAIPYLVQIDGLNIRTEQIIVDEFGINHAQATVLNEEGFFTEIVPGSNLLDPATGEECEWLKLSFPEDDARDITIQGIQATLDQVPANVWQCQESRLSGNLFKVPGKACDFNIVQ